MARLAERRRELETRRRKAEVSLRHAHARALLGQPVRVCTGPGVGPRMTWVGVLVSVRRSRGVVDFGAHGRHDVPLDRVVPAHPLVD
ncbi:MAG: hypothetical protein AAF533_24055 [Acidobacteriota bacterium]